MSRNVAGKTNNDDEADLVEMNPPAATTTTDSQASNLLVPAMDSSSSTSSSTQSSLAFLVTQYVEKMAQNEANAEVANHLRKATAELATAFAMSGAYGTTVRPHLQQVKNRHDHHHYHFSEQSSFAAPSHEFPSSYADAKRAHRCCAHESSPPYLETIVQAITSLEQSIYGTAANTPTTNWVQFSQERMLHGGETNDNNTSNATGSGRTLQEAIQIDTEQTTYHEMIPKTDRARERISIPALVGTQLLQTDDDEKKFQSDQKIVSLVPQILKESLTSMRDYLARKHEKDGLWLQSHNIRKSMNYQSAQKLSLAERQSSLVGNHQDETEDTASMQVTLADLKEQEMECDRVLFQLKRQLEGVEASLAQVKKELHVCETQSRASFRRLKSTLTNFYDPFRPTGQPLFTKNRALFSILSRRSGLQNVRGPLLFRNRSTTNLMRNTRISLLRSRFSHAATINTHLTYPVYCLRFDKTGRYFVTGADDYLVKVFKFGEYIEGKGNIERSSYQNGAVLVCTLRGHAGVINDIDVSSDNCFLATASEDGDCRIWGLYDGRPIAVLRGHKDGANMVSWSALTPYRLVTVSADGFARVWDVKKAAAKKYGKFLSTRPEYRVTHDPRRVVVSPDLSRESIPPPPLPSRGEERQDPPEVPVAALPLQPFPQPAGVAAEHRDAGVGPFAANDHLDDGVEIVEKYEHGALGANLQLGPGTRSRRTAVKVICVARCPNGGHFATGCDDGTCRIWADSDDTGLPKIDNESASFRTKGLDQVPLSNLVGGKLLLTLKGHLGPITDLQYSNRGDRLLSASQKDGMVRISSWNADPAVARVQDSNRDAPTSHILIKLVDPDQERSDTATVNRRRPSKSSSFISCDVATWTCDDSKVLTSQCTLIKPAEPDIVPCSQYIFVWDSLTGVCLMGISEAHTMQCPALIPHPRDASLACSAGADGVMCLWNLESCERIYSHVNSVDFGPVDPNEIGKKSGFLDGAFSTDGLTLVLTDDSGRVSIFNTDQKAGWSVPDWMTEQYFANDYYELLYQPNGYCLERGSELPPHIAPRGVRCSFTGSPWRETVNHAFKRLGGPSPIQPRISRLSRFEARNKLMVAKRFSRGLSSNRVSGSTSKALFFDGKGAGDLLKICSTKSEVAISVPSRRGTARGSPTTTQRLSSNWRWRDYNDVLANENEDDAIETDDEDFQLARGSHHGPIDDSDSDTEMGSRADVHPARSSNRTARRVHVDSESEDDFPEESLSTINEPFGPFKADYQEHLFRIVKQGEEEKIQRKRFKRVESTSSYEGRRSYTPQVGDTVVYIPRAHFECLKDFATIPRPWEDWPRDADWPLVQCKVRNVRYRFPFKLYLKDGHTSCVARVTLSVEGVPCFAEDRGFEWPTPSFVPSPSNHTFELCLFESDHAEYLIPSNLFISRMCALEKYLVSDSERKIEVFYMPEDPVEDAEMIAYPGTIVDHSFDLEDGIIGSHLTKSGYRSVVLVWEDGFERDRCSPWEININDERISVPMDRPRLSAREKALIRKGLALARTMDENHVFHSAVDTSIYVDYLNRVEIPMEFDFVAERLEADYYACKASVVADFKLIRDNSAKYNGPDSEYTTLAADILVAFEKEVLTETEILSFNDSMAIAVEYAPRESLGRRNSVSVNPPARPQRSSRSRQPTGAFYEDLPGSGGRGRAPRESRASDRPQRPGLRSRRSSARARSDLENAVLVGVPVALDHSNRRGRNNSSQRRASTRLRVSTQVLVSRSPEDLSAEPSVDQETRLLSRAERAARRSIHTGSNTEDRGNRDAENTARAETTSTRRTRQQTYSQPTATGSCPNEETAYAGRRKTREKANTSEDSESDSNEEGSSSSEDTKPTRQSRRFSTKRIPISHDKQSSRASPRRKKPSVSYEDPSSSDCGSDSSRNSIDSDSSDSDSDSVQSAKITRASARRSKGAKISSGTSGFTKSGHRKRPRRSSSMTAEDQPHSKRKRGGTVEWKGVDFDDIADVVDRVLDRLASLDEENTFATPVVETFPQLKDHYLNVVKEPMDFRTIRDERLFEYGVIEEFHQDLLKVFHNCILYNGEDDDLGQKARSFLDMLDDIFEATKNKKH